MKTETLLVKTNLCKTEFYLCAADGFCLGTFNTYGDASDWCRANGYNCRAY